MKTRKTLIIASLVAIFANNNVLAQESILNLQGVEQEIQQLLAFNIAELQKPEITTHVSKQIDLLQLTLQIDQLVLENRNATAPRKFKVVITE
jgi:hypothetical protein